MRRAALIAIAALPLASCAGPINVPVAVVSKGVPQGIMRGTITVSVSEGVGYFNVSSGALSCAGTYSLGHLLPTFSVPVLCNDGRKGIVIATRDYGGMSRGGTFTLTDGTAGDFIFGDAANKL